MRLEKLVAVTALVAGCTAEDAPPPPPPFEPLEPCPDCGQGRVRAGMELNIEAALAYLPDDRAVALTAFDDDPTADYPYAGYPNVLTYFDAGFAVTTETQTDSGFDARLVASPTGDVFVLDHPAQTSTVRAFSSDGADRWTVDVSDLGTSTSVFIEPHPSGVYVRGTSAARVYESDGTSRPAPWMRGEPDGTGGFIVTAGDSDAGTTTIKSVAADGQTRWERTWSASPGTVHAMDVHVAPSGDIAILGCFKGGMVNLGDRTLTGTTTQQSVLDCDDFVMRLDPTGAIRWVHTFGSVSGLSGFSLVNIGDAIVVNVHDRGRADSMLQTWTEAGSTTTHTIGGPGEQRISGLHANSDGSVTFRLSNQMEIEDDAPPAVADVGGLRLEGKSYVLTFVP